MYECVTCWYTVLCTCNNSIHFMCTWLAVCLWVCDLGACALMWGVWAECHHDVSGPTTCLCSWQGRVLIWQVICPVDTVTNESQWHRPLPPLPVYSAGSRLNQSHGQISSQVETNRHLMLYLRSMCVECSLWSPVYCVDKYPSWYQPY